MAELHFSRWWKRIECFHCCL